MVKAVLHAHSVWSYDGSWELPAIARLFGRMSADVVMMTEHDTRFDPARFAEYRAACADASTFRCTLVPGIEYSSPDNDIHILTWGLTEFLAEHRPVTETLTAVAEAGGAAIFAHPVRRDAWKQFDPAWVPLLSGIELWNRKSDGLRPGEEARRLIKETGLPATVGCDFHKAKHYYPLSHRIPTSGVPGALETDLVASIRQGNASPQAFGRALMDETGGPKPDGLHGHLEQARRRAIRVLRGRR